MESPGQSWLVLEFLESGTLRTWLYGDHHHWSVSFPLYCMICTDMFIQKYLQCTCLCCFCMTQRSCNITDCSHCYIRADLAVIRGRHQ